MLVDIQSFLQTDDLCLVPRKRLPSPRTEAGLQRREFYVENVSTDEDPIKNSSHRDDRLCPYWTKLSRAERENTE